MKSALAIIGIYHQTTFENYTLKTVNAVNADKQAEPITCSLLLRKEKHKELLWSPFSIWLVIKTKTYSQISQEACLA